MEYVASWIRSRENDPFVNEDKFSFLLNMKFSAVLKNLSDNDEYDHRAAPRT